jgi:plasmid stabilization system protein ParE
MVVRLIDRASSLDLLHLRGRVVPEYEDIAVREILERPYRIIYRVADDEIQILTVMHYRQLLPDDLVGSK